MSGKRTRALRAALKVNLPDADLRDHRAYRKSVRALRQMKIGTPRPRRTKGKPARRTWRVLGRRADGSERLFGRDGLTRSTAVEKATWLNLVSEDFWWAMHSLSYEPRAPSRKPIYDGKLAKLSHRRFWG